MFTGCGERVKKKKKKNRMSSCDPRCHSHHKSFIIPIIRGSLKLALSDRRRGTNCDGLSINRRNCKTLLTGLEAGSNIMT